MRIEFAEGDSDVIKDAQYQKMMRHLRKIASKGGELEPKALEKLMEQENAAQQSKGKKRGTDVGKSSNEAFLILTKRARTSAPSKKVNSDDEGDEMGVRNDDDDDDDDDETKIQPSFMDEDDEAELQAANKTATPAEAETSKANDDDEDYYKRAERLFNEQPVPGIIPTVCVIRINNLVMTVHTNELMNIKSLLPVLQPYGAYQNTKRFVAMTQRTTDPRSSTHVFGNGKMVTTGSKTADEATRSIQQLIDKIASITVQTAPGVYIQPHKNMQIRRSMVHNIVGSTTVPFKVDLNVFAKYEFVYYFRLMFVGAIVTVYHISQHEKDRNVKALVFDTGNIVFTGAKTTEHIDSVFKLLYPYVARSAVQTTLSSEAAAAKSNKRRFEADKKKAQAVPEGSASMIKIDPAYQVKVYKEVNANRETGQQMLDRERQSLQGTLGGLSTTSINMIAMDSMLQEQRRQSESSSLLLTQAPEAPKKIQILDRKTAHLFAD